MRRLFLAAVVCLAYAGVAAAQVDDSTRFDPSGHFAVYTGHGETANLEAIVSAMGQADVVFIGEQHDDPTGHGLELLLLEAAQRAYGSERDIVLSMEMFESDVQIVLNEYLAGYIREADFLKAARPWGDYESDYKPLIEFARTNGLPVIAANAPARYTSLARRRGLASLDSLSSAHEHLPREAENGTVSGAVSDASAAYSAKFEAEMADMGSHGSMPGMPSVEAMLVAQNLRDATMAFWIAQQLSEKQPIVIHINGSFHSQESLGIPEHLERYAPGTRMLVVTMKPTEDIYAAPMPANASPHQHAREFTILTDKVLIPQE